MPRIGRKSSIPLAVGSFDGAVTVSLLVQKRGRPTDRVHKRYQGSLSDIAVRVMLPAAGWLAYVWRSRDEACGLELLVQPIRCRARRKGQAVVQYDDREVRRPGHRRDRVTRRSLREHPTRGSQCAEEI